MSILLNGTEMVNGHIGSNQMNQNMEPKTFFLKGSQVILQK